MYGIWYDTLSYKLLSGLVTMALVKPSGRLKSTRESPGSNSGPLMCVCVRVCVFVCVCVCAVAFVHTILTVMQVWVSTGVACSTIIGGTLARGQVALYTTLAVALLPAAFTIGQRLAR